MMDFEGKSEVISRVSSLWQQCFTENIMTDIYWL
jgi:hypothetical protein